MAAKEGMYQAVITRCKELEAELARRRAELAEAKGTIDKLPKIWRLNEKGDLIQDAPAMPNDLVYIPTKKKILRGVVVFEDVDMGNRPFAYAKTNINHDGVCCQSRFALVYCYSTLEAAEAARGGGE